LNEEKHNNESATEFKGKEHDTKLEAESTLELNAEKHDDESATEIIGKRTMQN
jgi:hypothetical protein